MAETVEFGRVCRACGSTNDVDSKFCHVCGTDLGDQAEPPATRYVDDDPALRYVDPENRIELERFEFSDEAELACGLLRSHSIPCELSSMVIPGLPTDMILWVNNQDAKLAWALLADAEREASTNDNDVP
jgi:hypothetical protein